MQTSFLNLATDTSSWEIGEALAVIITSLVAGISAVYHFVIRKGKDEASEDIANKIINQRVSELEQRFEKLVADIQKYRDSQTDRLDKIIENQNKLANDISYIKGKLADK